MIFFLRIKLRLDPFFKKLSNPRINELKMSAGWDGTSKFMKVSGIPIDYIGIGIGVGIGYFLASAFEANIVLPFVLSFLAGVVGGIASYYYLAEKKYNRRILIYGYDYKKPK